MSKNHLYFFSLKCIYFLHIFVVLLVFLIYINIGGGGKEGERKWINFLSMMVLGIYIFFFIYFLQYWGLNSGPTP
jgi:hypothetical protein